MIEFLGGTATMAGRAVVAIFTPPWDFRALAYQIEALGLKSVGIASVTALAVGMVMGVQFAFGLMRFGSVMYVGKVVSIAIVRELGPVLTALMVGGRIGSGMAAELGSMRVTEQLDAIRSMGADPIRKLVAPRVLATLIILPLLTILADVLAVLGSMFIICLEHSDVTPAFYINSVFETIRMSDVISGTGKTFFFAMFIAIIGCYQGFSAEGGTEGVGNATTRTVVVTSTSILVSDFFLTKLFMAF
ncbi:MAG: ABC transporter permease [Deltaproteobacteria bacterium]|nr:ABC transporter permease [Deltaproteobacteria bacterium]